MTIPRLITMFLGETTKFVSLAQISAYAKHDWNRDTKLLEASDIWHYMSIQEIEYNLEFLNPIRHVNTATLRTKLCAGALAVARNNWTKYQGGTGIWTSVSCHKPVLLWRLCTSSIMQPQGSKQFSLFLDRVPTTECLIRSTVFRNGSVRYTQNGTVFTILYELWLQRNA